MAFTWGTPTTASSGAIAVTSLIINKPSGISEGDLMLTFLLSHTDPGTLTHTTLSPWQLIGTRGHSVSDGVRMSAYYLVAGASEPSTYTWQQSASFRFNAVCVELLGADTADVIDVASFTSDDSFNANIVCPDVTATDDDGLLVTMPGFTGTSAVTPPGGHTELFDWSGDTIATGGGGGAGYEILSASGATGTRTWTRDSTGSDRDGVASFIVNAGTAAPTAATLYKHLPLTSTVDSTAGKAITAVMLHDE